MLLDLKEAESGAALILAAVAADKVAGGIGTQVVVISINSQALTLDITDALSADKARRYREVFAVHLEKQLGEGFLVELDVETGLVTVELDMVDGGDVVLEGLEKPGQGDGAAPVKRGRGRPPGSRNKPEPPAE